MELMEAIRTRRSIRRYKPNPVDDKDVEAVLESAGRAPSWANTQCWRFIVVREEKIKKQLVGVLSHNNRATEAVENAPVTVVSCAELKKSGYYHDEPCTDKGDWYMFDVALAMQNMLLAAHALGLGTVLIGHFDSRKVESILGIPEGFRAVAMTPLGYPDQEAKAPLRKDLSEFVSYDKFGVKKSV